MSYAQNNLVVTLSHGENVSMFYGVNALVKAMGAAQSGDVINLSGGSFKAVNITKGVTLRGTGYSDALPTVINGDFTVNVASSDTCRLSMEGMRITGSMTMDGTFSNPYFLKCYFPGRIIYSSKSSIKNAIFANCDISGNSFSLYGSSTIQFLNCYVNGFQNSSVSASAFFLNCMIQPYIADGQYYASHIRYSQLVNCIIFKQLSGSNSAIPSTSIVLYSVSVGYNFFKNSQLKTDCTQATWDEVFLDDNIWHGLTDEAKTKYLGNDGTEVGVYGGLMPYNSTPSYPRITKMNVANKTTADGKLSVEIEVSAAE